VEYFRARPTALLFCWGFFAALASVAAADDALLDRAAAWQPASLPGIDAGWGKPSHRPARGAPAQQRANQRHVSSYLTPRECAVDGDSSPAHDTAVREPLPLPKVRATGPEPSPAASVAAAQPLPAPEPTPAASDATALTAPEARIPRLEIKEAERDLAERFVRLRLTSAAALVVDQERGNLLYAKNPGAVRSIASITKLMTAMVALDAGQSLDERITVQYTDVRISMGKESRLKVGVTLARREMLKLALMSSENRAAAALARTYPGGPSAFVMAMNSKAQDLDMNDTRFLEPTGLDSGNVSTARDLALMVNAAYSYPLIREFTTSDLHEVPGPDRRRHRPVVTYHNSNRLVRDSEWDVGLSKTGYIGKAGRCLVMQARIAAKPVIIVLLDSLGKVSRVADANRIRQWVEHLNVATPVALHDKPRM